MATLVTRSGKGSPLTHAEVDANFTNLNTDKLELSGGTMTGNLSFGDNDKAIFGAGSDLQIYHDGADSVIADVGTGNLSIQGTNLRLRNADNTADYITCNDGGDVKLKYANANKLVTTSTGIDVTGTVTADGLTVDGNVASITLNNTDTTIGQQRLGEINFDQNDPDGAGAGTVASMYALNRGSSSGFGALVFQTGTASSLADRMRIEYTGSISFYEDTGTTPKFFWDASAESLGIGTSSPSSKLHISGTYDTILDGNSVQFTRAGPSYIQNNTAGGYTVFQQASGEAMRIDSSGNVLIGGTTVATSSGGLNVEISSSGSTVSPLTLQNQSTGNGSGVYLTFRGQRNTGAQSDYTYIQSVADDTTAGNGSMRFHTLGGGTIAERMRIDSSGNVGIGTSSPTAVSGTTVLEITGTSGNAGAEVIIGSADTTATGNDLFGGLAFKSIDSNGTPPHYSGIKARAADTYGGANLEFYAGRSNYESNDPRFIIEGPQSVSGEAMRIDSSGNVGINKTAPSYALHVEKTPSASGFDGISFEDSSTVVGLFKTGSSYSFGSVGSNQSWIYSNTSDLNITSDGSGIIKFQGENGTERMRIDSSGNLLVGMTTPSNLTTGFAARANSLNSFCRDTATTDAAVLAVNKKTGDGDIVIIQKDGTTVGSIGTYSGHLDVVGDTRGARITDTAIIPISNSGSVQDNLLDLGYSGSRFKDLYLSGGVYLGGTGSANKLDDYEEGTWTPTIKGETTAGTATYLARWGNYTKVGNLVTVRFYINVNSFTGTGVMRIAGLPFTSGSDSGIHAGSLHPTRVNANITLTSAGSLSIAVVEGSTEGYFVATSVTSPAISSSINCDAAFACQFEGSYFV